MAEAKSGALRTAAGSKSATRKAVAKSPGSTLAGKLAKLGLKSRFDFILHLPLRYEDETRLTAIDALADGVFAQVEGMIESAEIHYRPRRTLIVRIADATGSLHLRFLNFYGSQVKALGVGKRLRVCGEARSGFFGAEMVHPRYREVEPGAALPQALTPVYPATAGVGQATLRRVVVSAIEAARSAGALVDTAPPVPHLGLMPFADAIDALHFPTPGALEGRDPRAWRRMKFDELLAQQLSLKRAYRARRNEQAPSLDGVVAGASLEGRLLAGLPFRLTGAQARALDEITLDLAAPHPMRRLLQGDVGSGKTVVAALAACRAIDRGYQAAFMAPTEILAEQHYRKLEHWLLPLGVEIAWLSGGLKKKDKEAAIAAVASGAAPLAVGTHALFQDKVSFNRLGLAIIDEQHRFGVEQRLRLADKGRAAGTVGSGSQPHQLMMSATPIPRTLAMTFYADLDVSVIDELPPGRTPIATRLVSESRRDEIVERIRTACQAGRQVYWVCPLIEESAALELQTAVETHQRLTEMLPGLRVALVHGRMKPEEKIQAMAGFVAGDIKVLVATTVIEVGVDVPNATLMVIEHAERFGLAQLHQLRGRVGRGIHESVCVLLYQSPLSEGARERLKVMFESTDGFEIARADLRLRGPGEFLGRQQSGVPLLRFADLESDTDLIEAARDCAQAMLDAADPRVEAHLERWLGSREAYLGA